MKPVTVYNLWSFDTKVPGRGNKRRQRNLLKNLRYSKEKEIVVRCPLKLLIVINTPMIILCLITIVIL